MFSFNHLPLAFTTTGKMCARLYNPYGTQAQINLWIACMENAKPQVKLGRTTLGILMAVGVIGIMAYPSRRKN